MHGFFSVCGELNDELFPAFMSTLNSIIVSTKDRLWDILGNILL